MASWGVDTVDEVRFEFWCRCRGQYAMNQRLYLLSDLGGIGTVDADVFLAAAATLVRAYYLSILPEDAEWYGASLQKVLPNETVPVTNVAIDSGAIPGLAMPTTVASLVAMRAGALQRRRCGRTYLPFPPVSAMGTDGKITASYLSLLDDWVTGTLRSFSVYPDGVNEWRLTPITRNPVLGTRRVFNNFFVRDKFATMHSRTLFQGADAAPF